MKKLLFLAIAAIAVSAFADRPKYVFLFIGDGMSVPQRMTAEEFSRKSGAGPLAMNAMPFSAMTRTCSSDSLVTDSAAAATAMACGVKTKNHYAGVDPEGKPRYKAYESEPVGKDAGFAVFSFSAELRHIYNPASEFQFYSAIGFGACSYTPLPLLSLTPIALRWTSDHLYGFSEFSLLSASTWLCHLGLGWRF